MAIDGKIAGFARGEMPRTWDALLPGPGITDEPIHVSRIRSVKIKLFGQDIIPAVEAALDDRVAEYAGKLVALSLINAGIDHWGRQPVSLGARQENKQYVNHADDLRELRANLIAETRLMWPEVSNLLPNVRGVRAGIPRVQQSGTTVPHVTPSPDDFEPPFGPKTG